MMLPRARTLYAAVQPVNLRSSFDVLVAIAQEQLGVDVLHSAIVIFFNRSRDRCKLIFHDGSGIVIWFKRSDRRRFHIPSAVLPQHPSIVLDLRELALIFDGHSKS